MARSTPHPHRCRCRVRMVIPGKKEGDEMIRYRRGGRPMLIASFDGGELVSIRRIHYGARDNCPVPDEEIPLADWHASVRQAGQISMSGAERP